MEPTCPRTIRGRPSSWLGSSAACLSSGSSYATSSDDGRNGAASGRRRGRQHAGVPPRSPGQSTAATLIVRIVTYSHRPRLVLQSHHTLGRSRVAERQGIQIVGGEGVVAVVTVAAGLVGDEGGSLPG